MHEIVLSSINELIEFVRTNIHWFGALGTLGTFAFGLVTGIRQAKRYLPRRLVEFMREQLTPVYDNTEALVAAVAHRSAEVAQKKPLYLKHELDRALDALGVEWRPRWKQGLDESIREAETYIETTETRLQYLKDIRSHAQVLRGAVRSYEWLVRRSDEAIKAEVDGSVEADFTSAIENDTTKMAALELRGLLRARRLGNLKGAYQDFVDLQTKAEELFCLRGQARALRLQSEILVRRSAGENARLLLDARRALNTADELFEDGRTLGDADWYERGQNREAYGTVQAALATLAETNHERAIKAFRDALKHYRSSKITTQSDIKRVEERMGGPPVADLRAPLLRRLWALVRRKRNWRS